MKIQIKIVMMVAVVALMAGCGSKKIDSERVQKPVGPEFLADSAFLYCKQQCDFGPRIMNSEAHERCGEWIADQFRSRGMEVVMQRADLKGYDGTSLKSTNIIASYRPEAKERILLCAHWDSRPWADNDPDEANWHTAVMAANDGASGVAVMLEIARLVTMKTDSQNTVGDRQHTAADSLQNTVGDSLQLNPRIGIDFICFDAEDWGVPQWEERSFEENSWALGSEYWAEHPHKEGYQARYGILLDMVGGQGAQFYQELFSKRYASHVVNRVWKAASVVGYGSFFPSKEGGMITDDHVAVNQIANIPCIDIIPCYPDCEESTFGPTWHTIHDDMQHIDRLTLKAVGQTIIQVLYSEE